MTPPNVVQRQIPLGPDSALDQFSPLLGRAILRGHRVTPAPDGANGKGQGPGVPEQIWAPSEDRSPLARASRPRPGAEGAVRGLVGAAPPRSTVSLGTTAEFAAAHQILSPKWVSLPEARATRETLQDAVGELLPQSRCRLCQRRPRFREKNATGPIQVAIAEEGSAHLRGVFVCGNVWICPTCTSRISEGRRQELRSAGDGWIAAGNTLLFSTFTHPHTKYDKLADNLHRSLIAMRWITGHRRYRKLRAGIACIGQVRALEVTHGEANGWHPHFHVLMFIEGKKYRSDRRRRKVERILRELWREACVRHGLQMPSDDRGVTVQDGSYASSYVQKWGCVEELTKAHVKKGKNGSLNPWGLLHAYAFDGDKDAGKLFVEYAEAFKGRSQLQWSRGLRDKLGLNKEKTDQELAENADVKIVASANISTWRGTGGSSDFDLVVRHRARAWVCAAVDEAYKVGAPLQPAVDSVIAALRARENAR